MIDVLCTLEYYKNKKTNGRSVRPRIGTALLSS